MYDYFSGTIEDKRRTTKGTFVTVDISGIGYLLEMTEKDYLSCILKSQLKLYVALIHREDAMSLYGFLSKETRDIFQILLSVSGVGAKMALALLNEFDVYELISFVLDGNFKELTRAKGIGPKLAQKIILELRDKLIKTELPQSKHALPENQAICDTKSVLLSLGYDENEIEDTLSKLYPTLVENISSEELLRKALTHLSM